MPTEWSKPERVGYLLWIVPLLPCADVQFTDFQLNKRFQARWEAAKFDEAGSIALKEKVGDQKLLLNPIVFQTLKVGIEMKPIEPEFRLYKQKFVEVCELQPYAKRAITIISVAAGWGWRCVWRPQILWSRCTGIRNFMLAIQKHETQTLFASDDQYSSI